MPGLGLAGLKRGVAAAAQDQECPGLRDPAQSVGGNLALAATAMFVIPASWLTLENGRVVRPAFIWHGDAMAAWLRKPARLACVLQCLRDRRRRLRAGRDECHEGIENWDAALHEAEATVNLRRVCGHDKKLPWSSWVLRVGEDPETFARQSSEAPRESRGTPMRSGEA